MWVVTKRFCRAIVKKKKYGKNTIKTRKAFKKNHPDFILFISKSENIEVKKHLKYKNKL